MTQNSPIDNKLFSDRWHIPGMGEQKEYCGLKKWITLKCSSGQKGHDHQELKHSCKRYACPICYDEAAWKEAFRAAERLEAFRTEWRKAGRQLRHEVHVITSPPKEQYYLEPGKIKEISREILQEIGFVGGTEIFHPYRGRTTTMDKIRRREIIPIYSAHVHNIGFMPDRTDEKLFDADKIREISARTGWVIKIMNRKIQKGPNAGQYFSVVNRIHYELTHCGIDQEHPSAHRLTWWGLTAYNNATVEEKTELEEHLCSVCGAPVHQYSIHDMCIRKDRKGRPEKIDTDELGWYEHDGDEITTEEIDEGPHMIKRIYRVYTLKPNQVDRNKIKYGWKLGPEITPVTSLEALI